MDNTAFRTDTKQENGRVTQSWTAEFVAAVFSQRPRTLVSDAVVQLAEKLGLAHDEKAKETIAKRLRPFLMDIQPGTQVLLRAGGGSRLKLGPGGRDGISADVLALGASAPPGNMGRNAAVVPDGTKGLLECRTFFAREEGWAVISDIDDTIKRTLTAEPLGILRTTFVDEPQPIPGMPELYAFLQQRVTAASPFFYLSASPYNLYPLLHGFRDAYYPSQGQLLLRDSSWMSLSDLLANLTLGTQEYKVDQISKIHSWFPKRRMICVGDSTQTDPEAYAEMYRQTGGDWIRLILIRRVTGVAALGIKGKNKPERFEKAFEGIPKGVWHVFEEPSECYGIIREVTT